MSLLSAVERATEACRAEQAKMNHSIQLYRDMLQTLTPQPRTGSEDPDCADVSATDTDSSLREKEDIELLERALEKALQVRTATGGPSKKDPDRNKPSAHQKEPVVTPREGMQTNAASRGNRTATGSSSKSASLDRKKARKPGPSVSSALGPKSSAGHGSGRCKTTTNRTGVTRASQRDVTASGSLGQGHPQASVLHVKNKTTTRKSQSGDDLCKAAAISTTSSNNIAYREPSGAPGLPQQNGMVSDPSAKWRSLRSKQNRLWDKVVELQRKPEPGRKHFMERMRATFPGDWPHGSPDQTRALVDRLTARGLDLAQHRQTQQLLARQTPQAAAEPGCKENKYDSLTPERLQMTAAELRSSAEQAKHEWEAWDRWRPEGGCLCPGANGASGDGIIALLPPTINYTTEAELRKLEALRMRVSLLQQEVHLEQALSDTLSPHLPSIAAGPGCPNVSVLRDTYSLLGEGGQRFPAIVLDTEPD